MNDTPTPPPFTIREPMGKLLRMVGIHPDTLRWMAETGRTLDAETAYIETRLTADEYRACIERGKAHVKETPRPHTDAQGSHYASLIAHIEANSSRHPWYGPCDAMGDNGSCYECDKIIARVPDLERQLAEARANEAAMSQIAVSCQCPSKDHEIAILRSQLAEATREIDILRRYGNKDCTAMADEEPASANQQEKPSVLVSGQCAGVLEMYYRQPLPNPPNEKP